MPNLTLRRAQGHRPGDWGLDDYDVLADGHDVGRIFRINAATEVWWWGVGFQFTGRKRYGTAGSLDEAKAAFRAQYERWKQSGLTISDTESMNDRDPNDSAKFSLPPEPLPERILHKLGDLCWLIVMPLAAAVAGYVFLNMTIGMSLGTWLIALFVMYICYRICVRLDL